MAKRPKPSAGLGEDAIQGPEAMSIMPVEHVQSKILLIRGQKLILDVDLARLYGVPTKRLNEQVKRNIQRFPADFMFQVTDLEKAEVVANCDHLARLKYSSALPYAFTEHGAIMAASVLNSERAVQASIFAVRAVVRLKQMLAPYKELSAEPRSTDPDATIDRRQSHILKWGTERTLRQHPPPRKNRHGRGRRPARKSRIKCRGTETGPLIDT